MARTLRTAALALALTAATWTGGLTPAHASAPVATAVSTASVGTTSVLAAAPRKARVRTRHVRPGHEPVSSRNTRKVRLVFRARRGQLVNLAQISVGWEPACVKRTLKRMRNDKRSKRVKRFADGYWRLPRTGTYVGTYTWCDVDDVRPVQLRRTTITRVPVGRGEVTISSNRRRSHLASVRVDGPVTVTTGSQDSYANPVILPDRSSTGLLVYGTLSLAPGTVPFAGRVNANERASTSGRHLVPVDPGSSVSAEPAQTHSAVVDGPATVLATGDRARHILEFHGNAGDWIHLETTTPGPESIVDADVLHGPDGRLVTKLVRSDPCAAGADCPRDRTAWMLPATGTYQLSRFTQTGTEGVRVRKAAVAPAMVAGGPAVTYTSPTPGQWVIGSITHPATGARPTLRAANVSSSLTRFRASAVSGFVGWCEPFDTNPGCGDYSAITVTESRLEASDTFWIGRPEPVIVLQVPPGVQGSVDLAWP